MTANWGLCLGEEKEDKALVGQTKNEPETNKEPGYRAQVVDVNSRKRAQFRPPSPLLDYFRMHGSQLVCVTIIGSSSRFLATEIFLSPILGILVFSVSQFT